MVVFYSSGPFCLIPNPQQLSKFPFTYNVLVVVGSGKFCLPSSICSMLSMNPFLLAFMIKNNAEKCFELKCLTSKTTHQLFFATPERFCSFPEKN